MWSCILPGSLAVPPMKLTVEAPYSPNATLYSTQSDAQCAATQYSIVVHVAMCNAS